MMTAEENVDPRKVGPDLVTVQGDTVCIDAAREMPDWAVREFNRIPIYFQDRKYFLRLKLPGQRHFKVRYILEPWPADHSSSAKFSFSYDEQAVAERDANFKTGRLNAFVGHVLHLGYPFLGLLWSGTKDRLIRFGIVPRSITRVSVATVFFALFVEGILAGRLQLGLFSWIFGKAYVTIGGWDVPVPFFDFALVGLFLIDCIARYDALLRDSPIEWGFLEWIKKPFLHGKKTLVVNGVEITPAEARAMLKQESGTPNDSHKNAA